MTEPLWHDENCFLAVTMYQDASVSILDKVSGREWHMGRVALQEEGPVEVGDGVLCAVRDPNEEYPGRFRGVREGERLRFTVFGRGRQEMGQFTCRVRLNGVKLEVHLFQIDEALPSLMFPPPIESESLVVPVGVGRWIRQPLSGRYFWLYPAPLNMRWFGGLKRGHGWIAIVDEGYSDMGVLASKLSLTAGWLKSQGNWLGARSIVYQFIQGDYVALAKTFLVYLLEKKLYCTLYQKVASRPALRHLLGTRILSFSNVQKSSYEIGQEASLENHAVPPTQPDGDQIRDRECRVAGIVNQVRALGMRHALIMMRDSERGSNGEHLCSTNILASDRWINESAEVSHDQSDAFPTVCCKNYQHSDQQRSGLLRSSVGSAICIENDTTNRYVVNSRDGLAAAKDQWEEIRRQAPQALFLQTTLASQFYESYEPGNRLSRAQDEAYKQALLLFYRKQGLLVGSEEGADFGMHLVDWVEQHHQHIVGESIPLWSLVFHGSAFATRVGNPLAAESSESAAPRWLAGLLWGYLLSWDISMRECGIEDKKNFVAMHHVDYCHRRIGMEEMLGHRFLTADSEVEETTFASGVSIVANFSARARAVEGMMIPSYGYLIRRQKQYQSTYQKYLKSLPKDIKGKEW